MNKINNPEKTEWADILKRPSQPENDIQEIVSKIFDDIRINGDVAVRKYTANFDNVVLDSLNVSNQEIEDAINIIPQELKEAIILAKANIEKFHRAQISEKIVVETTVGVNCWLEKRPIQKVGLYIPGGSAPLFSTVLMLAIPAQIAGCKEVIICTPPDKFGKINPVILYTANLCGVKTILKVGGIQAIASLTFGTDAIPKVYKIFGPGNQYVTKAKQIATRFGVAIDMPAGPSELLIIADDTAIPSFVAADLLSQAEHGSDSQVILVSTSKKLLDAVESEINCQILELPRKDIAKKAIENSKMIYVENNQLALDLTNDYGPEHLIICTNNNDFFVKNIVNAGSVFIGNYSPESAGDYASGTNHTLPTNGFTKNYSGVNLDSFLKSISFQEITKIGIKNIGKAVEIMAETEGLQAHKNAITLRLNSL